jgi:hypothetical protein
MIFKSFPKEMPTIYMCINALRLIARIFPGHQWGNVLMATAKYGKGTVFAVVDPWLYNEYTDGRKLPQTYDNFAAGEELVRWLLQQVAEEGHSDPIR